MARFGSITLVGLSAALNGIVLWWNMAIHQTPIPGSTEELEQVDAVLRASRDGMHGDLPWRMQRLFPEGAAFSYALYGLSNCQVALQRPLDDRGIQLEEARWSMDGLRSERVRGGFPALLPPGHGIFYAGWSALLEGSLIEASGVEDPLEVSLFRQHCDTIAGTFAAAGSSFPASYNGMAWPADATVAIAALALHDRLFPDRYDGTVSNWVERVRAETPPGEGIAHAWDPDAGVVRTPMRGSSMALMCVLLPSIDAELAKEQFGIFRKEFFAERFGVPVISEFPKGQRGLGDVDSGPLILGAGAAAMIFGAGACRMNGDAFHDLEMSSTTDGFGFVFGKEERTYLFGAMPIADLFIVWSRSRSVSNPVQPARPMFLRFHLWSTVLMFLIWAPFVWRALRKKRRRVLRNQVVQ